MIVYGFSPEEIAMLLVGMSIAFCILAFFLWTLQNAIQVIAPANRKISPNQVWLTFVPFFGFIWIFIMVMRVADSFGEEIRKRNLFVFEERPGLGIGLAWCFFEFLFFILQFAHEPLITAGSAIPALICFVIYWLRIMKYKKLITDDSKKNISPPIAIQQNISQTAYGIYGPQNFDEYHQFMVKENIQSSTDHSKWIPPNLKQNKTEEIVKKAEKNSDDLSKWMPKQNK
ncbi:MAG: hypothetical protein HY064_13900 [Bacteroidetes bacterium]|nr:hypothetical protein [Bacteroidota bacterium]